MILNIGTTKTVTAKNVSWYMTVNVVSGARKYVVSGARKYWERSSSSSPGKQILPLQGITTRLITLIG